MSELSYRVEDGIAVLVIDNPPVNALSAGVRSGLLECVRRAESDPAVKAAVLIGAGSTFVAGADIREFGKPLQGPSGRAALAAVESATKPVVAALHGNALGGGLELALCCHYRVALPSTNLGLPEVNIGLVPGAGGTQRLPRLVGVPTALDLILAGKPVDGRKAQALGVVDQLVEGEGHAALLAGALAFAQRVVAEARPLRRVRDLDDRLRDVDPALFRQTRERNARKWKGLLAPQRIVDCIEAACTRSFDEGYAFELAAFEECKASPQRAALSHVFFAEREAAKLPGIGAGTPALAVQSVAVIGAGTMGGGIAMAFANHGFQVRQLEMGAEALERGRGIIRRNYETSVGRGSMTQAQADAAMDRIGGTLSHDDIGDCDLVIEAVFEDMAVKQEVFGRLDAVMKPGAILATNTSTLNIDRIAEATQRPQSVVGLHFFSPANVMKLMEVVRGAQTSPQVLLTAMALAKRIGKIAVLAGNCDGFIGNRILAAYGREADFLLEEGATPWQVDDALMAFGLPMGLYRMRDLSGLDIGWRIRKYRERFRDPALRYSPIADRLCEQGRFGQKTGAGYYRYERGDGGRVPTPDPTVEELIAGVSKELGLARRPVTDAEIVDRVIIAMVNEGAKIVGEGFAQRASDIDVTYVHGYGFPRYRGGPMFWAEQQGLSRIHDKVREYQRIHGKLWEPAPLLEQAARTGSWQMG